MGRTYGEMGDTMPGRARRTFRSTAVSPTFRFDDGLLSAQFSRRFFWLVRFF